MKRRVESHEECLRAFSLKLKQEIKSSLLAWQQMDAKHAEGRRMAYVNVLFMLKEQAESHGIALADLGLVDYEVPKLSDHVP